MALTNMLEHVSILYLGASVLILLEKDTVTRFWPLLEAWFSMQVATATGLHRYVDMPKRHAILPMGSTPVELGSSLEMMVWTRMEELEHFIQRPDIKVTNGKDKEVQVKKLMKINSLVKDAVRRDPTLVRDEGRYSTAQDLSPPACA